MEMLQQTAEEHKKADQAREIQRKEWELEDQERAQAKIKADQAKEERRKKREAAQDVVNSTMMTQGRALARQGDVLEAIFKKLMSDN